MPRAVADPLFYRLIDAFPPHRAYGSAALDHEPMPPPIAHFLKHWLTHRLRQETARLDLPRSDWFDDTHEAVQEARQALVEALIDRGHFPPGAWELSLREAVQQVTAYLVRPVDTLTAFVFPEDTPAVSADVMDWRLGYFKAYGYFHEAMRLYVEQRQVETIKRDLFTELLRKVDQKITKNHDAEAWLRLLAPLFDLARRADLGQGVPVPLLRTFFGDKGAESVTDRLQAFQQQRGAQALDAAALRGLLESADEPVPAPVSATPNRDTPASAAPAGAEPAVGPVPRWKQFQQTLAQAPAEPEARRSVTPLPDEVPPSSQTREARPRWMQFRAESSPSAGASAPAPSTAPMDLDALEQALLGEAGARNRSLFVNNLFTRSVDDYHRVLRTIYDASSWAEASQIIAEEVFRRHRVDIYSNPAVLFTDAIEARYTT